MTDLPMKEGPEKPTPRWLENYDRSGSRERLTEPERQYFDNLWARAIGNKLPGLSGRERAVLINFLERKP